MCDFTGRLRKSLYIPYEIVAHLICESSVGKFNLPIVYIYLLISQAHCFYFVFSKEKNLGVNVLYNTAATGILN